MKISREQAIEIIKKHGFEPTQLTATDKEGAYIQGTSFFSELGNKKEYTLEAVYRWLGY